MARRFSMLYFILSFFTIAMYSQNGVIQGTITDSETDEGLIGATIVIQGTTKGTITDFDGNYALTNLNTGTYNVVISYISYDQVIVQVKVGEEPVNLNYTLKPTTIGIDEVVVKK
ncbi:MAG: carboxypeptidase-like regulatory domain-containing protein [Bacteroidales bacterium]|nr:carboxypeptidase-like regulatory domain-containing protein [Bacteroidales bacterium]